jgi:hypothetical protein
MMANKVEMDFRDLLDLRDHKEPLVLLDLLVVKVSLEPLDLKGRKDQKDLLAMYRMKYIRHWLLKQEL